MAVRAEIITCIVGLFVNIDVIDKKSFDFAVFFWTELMFSRSDNNGKMGVLNNIFEMRFRLAGVYRYICSTCFQYAQNT